MKLIAIEGADGCGKSTMCQLLKTRHPEWYFTSEPCPWTRHGVLARELLSGKSVYPREALLHLMLLARCEHQQFMEGLDPDLDVVNVVITDRHNASILVYQAEFYKQDTLLDLCRRGPTPFATVIIGGVSAQVIAERCRARGAKEPYLDQLDSILRRYTVLFRDPPACVGHCLMVDALGLTSEEVTDRVEKLVLELLNRP